MAAWNTGAALSALVAFLEGLSGSGLQKVYTGSPESFANRVNAYVALLPRAPTPFASGGLMQRTPRFFVGIGYRVKGAEATAETTLAAIVDAFENAFFDQTTNPGRNFGGTLDNAQIEPFGANEPQYQELSGVEFRIYPLIVTGQQQQTFNFPLP